MLQSWADYLLGSSQDSRRTMHEGVAESAHLATLNDRLIDNLEDEHLDEDWVLISTDHIEDNRDDMEALTDEVVILRRVPSVRELLTRTSSSSSLHSNDVEESWFLTPPPCFTTAGPSNMRISPFENLLIEHPSMSVYNHASSRRGCVWEILHPPSERDGSPERINDDNLEVGEVDNEAVIVRMLIRRCRIQVQVQERQYSKYMHSKKIQIQKANKPLKKGYLERNNMAREVNCRNFRLRRGERSQGVNRSCVNNNRKC